MDKCAISVIIEYGGVAVNYAAMGSRIKERRNAFRLSQEKLAEMVNVTTSYIGQIERAERIPSLETLVNISNALKVTVDFLLKDSISVEDDIHVKLITEMLLHKSSNAKATAVDVVQALLMHIE